MWWIIWFFQLSWPQSKQTIQLWKIASTLQGGSLVNSLQHYRHKIFNWCRRTSENFIVPFVPQQPQNGARHEPPKNTTTPKERTQAPCLNQACQRMRKTLQHPTPEKELAHKALENTQCRKWWSIISLPFLQSKQTLEMASEGMPLFPRMSAVKTLPKTTNQQNVTTLGGAKPSKTNKWANRFYGRRLNQLTAFPVLKKKPEGQGFQILYENLPHPYTNKHVRKTMQHKL